MSRQTDEQLDAVTEAVRAAGYIDLRHDDELAYWREDVVERVIDVLRAAGWTVEPPSDDTQHAVPAPASGDARCEHRVTWQGLTWPQEAACQDCGATVRRPASDDASEPVYGALARAEALAADDPDWMNCKQWPRPAADASPVGTEVLTSPPVTDDDRAILTFAALTWKRAGSRDAAIREQLGLTPTAFYARLLRLLDEPAALAADPVLVHRLRRMRDNRRRWAA